MEKKKGKREKEETKTGIGLKISLLCGSKGIAIIVKS
jgi:hypothetical protein